MSYLICCSLSNPRLDLLGPLLNAGPVRVPWLRRRGELVQLDVSIDLLDEIAVSEFGLDFLNLLHECQAVVWCKILLLLKLWLKPVLIHHVELLMMKSRCGRDDLIIRHRLTKEECQVVGILASTGLRE